jgi:lipopolysaccharide transport system ATP-binding protein
LAKETVRAERPWSRTGRAIALVIRTADQAMTDIAIRAENLGKQYRIRPRAAFDTLREALGYLAFAPFHRFGRAGARLSPASENGKRGDTIWALRDVSFDVQRGEVVGIIGRNGAGKSTLFKILSRLTHPTTGRADIRGRIASLLEVGVGFHPQLTGRENIYLSGAVLGMRGAEIRRRFDEIVAFAEVEGFIDMPVKQFSTGMYMRLAFAVAAHLEPDILLVDEVLAVGDAAFQDRCLGKMKHVASTGRTVLFISHDMHPIALLCSKGLLIERGRVAYFGEVHSAITEYLRSIRDSHPGAADFQRQGSGEYRFTFVRPTKAVFDAGEKKEFRFRIERPKPAAPRSYLSAHIVNELGITVAQCDSRLVGLWLEDCKVLEGNFSFVSPWLKPGRYHLEVFIWSSGPVDHIEHACAFDISPVIPYPHPASRDGTAKGIVFADFMWSPRPASPNESPCQD